MQENNLKDFLDIEENMTKKTTIAFNSFAFFLLGFEIIIIILLGIFSTYDPELNQNINSYPYFQDVHVMIFIGFGFLMTFLKKYGFSSIGLTFLIAAITIQLHPLLDALWNGILTGVFFPVYFNISALITSDFAAGAVLISFGSVLGKLSPLQLVLMVILELFFYTMNEKLAVVFSISDIGGSMVIHTFGAFFGLACSKIITTNESKSHSDNSSSYTSDLFAMIGTIFLWMFWPSFNACMATKPDAFNRAVVNTILSLTGSCIVSFVFSYILRNQKKFCMVDIQNATLAGGVAIGAAADLPIGPAASLSVGLLAGFISLIGYTRLQSIVESKLGIYDTCGVLNLHGLPGILGGLVVFIFSGVLERDLFLNSVDYSVATYIRDRSGLQHSFLQFSFLICTLFISIASGLFTGYLIKNVEPSVTKFNDAEFWEMPQESDGPEGIEMMHRNISMNATEAGKFLKNFSYVEASSLSENY